MKTKKEIVAMARELAEDERLRSYSPALLNVNAPLALVQVEMANRLRALNWVLDGDAIDLSELRYFNPARGSDG